MYRQGDVLIVPVDAVPEGVRLVAREAGRLVLAHGEVTGHAHVVEGAAALFALDSRLATGRFLRVEGDASVVHEEHDSIVLPPGAYEIRRQREYHPVAPRPVID